MSPIQKIVLWILSTISALVLLFGYHTSTSGPTGITSATSVISGTAADTAPPTPRGRIGARTTAPKPSHSFTGDVADTEWGPVQVELIVGAGSVSKVNVVQYPTGEDRDQEINSHALPILIQETLSAQSAQIDMVSGATVTSDGYVQSLQSALDQAGL